MKYVTAVCLALAATAVAASPDVSSVAGVWASNSENCAEEQYTFFSGPLSSNIETPWKRGHFICLGEDGETSTKRGVFWRVTNGKISIRELHSFHKTVTYEAHTSRYDEGTVVLLVDGKNEPFSKR